MISMRDSGVSDFGAGRYMAGSRGASSTPRRATTGKTRTGTLPPQPLSQNRPEEDQPGYQDYESVMGAGAETPQGSGVQMPQEWGQASQMYQNAATNPWFGQAAAGYGQMAQTGMPTDQTAAWQSAKGVAQQDIVDAMKQAQEQMGASSYGKRYSKAMGGANQEIASRRMGELGSQFTQMEMGAQEQARQRQMASMGGLVGAASGYGANQMNAGAGMADLGSRGTGYGLNLADRAFQYGSGMQQGQQQQAQDLGNYWQGNQWWSNPALQGGMNMSQFSPDYMYPQYGQSTVGRGMNFLWNMFGG